MKFFILLVIIFFTVSISVLAEEEIIKGETTKEEILKNLGKPSSIKEKNGETVWVYLKTKARSLIGERKIRDPEAFLVVFDEDGKVEDYFFRLENKTLRRWPVSIK